MNIDFAEKNYFNGPIPDCTALQDLIACPDKALTCPNRVFQQTLLPCAFVAMPYIKTTYD